MAMRDVQRIVDDVVRQQLAADFVGLVNVDQQTDDVGENTLRVRIVINRDSNPDERRKMLGLVRHIRSAMEDIPEIGFPIIDFVSKSDAVKLGLEAA